MDKFRELADWNKIKNIVTIPDILGLDLSEQSTPGSSGAPATASPAQGTSRKRLSTTTATRDKDEGFSESVSREPSSSNAQQQQQAAAEDRKRANSGGNSSKNPTASSTKRPVSHVQSSPVVGKTLNSSSSSKVPNPVNKGCEKLPSTSNNADIELAELSSSRPRASGAGLGPTSARSVSIAMDTTHQEPSSPQAPPPQLEPVQSRNSRISVAAQAAAHSGPQPSAHPWSAAELKRKFFRKKAREPTMGASVDSLDIRPIVGRGLLTEGRAMVIVVAAATAAAFLTALILWLLIGLATERPQEVPPGHREPPRSWIGGLRPPSCAISRIDLCHRHRVGFSYIALPNALGQSDQALINSELANYEKLVSVKCYSLLPDFLCSMFAPKCGSTGRGVPVCRSVCKEAKRKCDFFLKVFSLRWPVASLDCESLPDSPDPDICVGARKEELMAREAEACIGGHRCDSSARCTPASWVCDGYVDCRDGSDERNCSNCGHDQFHCGSGTCVKREDICDGIRDCPDGRDERLCLRLNDRMGTTSGQGRLEAWSAVSGDWTLVCGEKWDSGYMSNRACRKLGYREANSTWIRDESKLGGAPRDRAGAPGPAPALEAKSFFYKGRSKGCQGGGNQLGVYLSCKNFECGQASVDNQAPRPSARIVGGTESFPGQWPWLVGLHGGTDEVFFCGGVLISQRWVLSAAHCVGNQTDTAGWMVQLGLTRRTASPLFVRKRALSAIVKHPSFNSANLYGNDIALLQLEHPVDFDEFLRPVCLPPDGLSLATGTRCTVVGWGKSVHAEDADYLNVVHEVEVPLVHHSVCAKWYSLQDVPIGETMLCAGYPEGQKDACQGDSGGPLLCKDGPGEAWYVAGIVSWGINCAQPNLPGIYTNVGMYKDWIRAVTAEHGHPVND